MAAKRSGNKPSMQHTTQSCVDFERWWANESSWMRRSQRPGGKIKKAQRHLPLRPSRFLTVPH
jgi:hypothetical protein